MKDDFFQALANPCRREIIRLLRWHDLSAGEIAAHFDISQPSISRHLDVLKRAEVVTATRKANQIIYSLNLSVMEELYMELTGLLGKTPEEEEAACETE
ncbi:MAG: autorepressor SdpR family transcription factor [Clostridiales bacterium]|nr:autorepressor SdpR family transcription factor [Clostridiales bacterium]